MVPEAEVWDAQSSKEDPVQECARGRLPLQATGSPSTWGPSEDLWRMPHRYVPPKVDVGALITPLLLSFVEGFPCGGWGLELWVGPG